MMGKKSDGNPLGTVEKIYSPKLRKISKILNTNISTG
jgi:hypothetical protein